MRCPKGTAEVPVAGSIVEDEHNYNTQNPQVEAQIVYRPS